MEKTKNALFNTIGYTVSLFCQWLIIMLIPKIGNFSDAGIFSVAISICSIFNIVATFQLNQYQISDQYARYTEADYYRCRVFTIMLSFVCCAITVLLLGYSFEQNCVIIGYMLYRNLIHFSLLHAATLQVEHRLDYVGKCMIAEGVISLVSFVVTYYFTDSIILSTLIMAIIGGGTYLMLIIRGYKHIIGRRYSTKDKSNGSLKELIKIGFPLLLAGVSPIIITALPKLTLQKYCGDEIVGIFSTLSAPTIIIPTLITGVLAAYIVSFSNMAKEYNMKKIRKRYLQCIGTCLLFGALCELISLTCAEFCFKIMYGQSIIEYVDYFHVLVIGIVFYSIGMCGCTILITKDQCEESAIASLLSLAISIVIILWAVPRYGISGATYGLVASYGAFCLIVSLYVLLCPLSPTLKTITCSNTDKKSAIANELNVLYQFDSKYASYAGISITSLLKNNNSEKINFYIITSAQGTNDLKKIEETISSFGKSLFIIDAKEIDSKLDALGVPSYRGSQATNYKLFIKEYIPESVDRIIYLDSDTIVCNDISGLMDIDLENNILGMVLDSASNNAKKIRGINPNECYFNAGIIVFDLKKWREFDSQQAILDHLKSSSIKYYTPDQDLINIVLKNKIKTISPRYNLQPFHIAYSSKTYLNFYKPKCYYSAEEIDSAVDDPAILHTFRFLGEFPWHYNNYHPQKNYFDYYMSISLWSDYVKRPSGMPLIYSVEKSLYKLLPKWVFIRAFSVIFYMYTIKQIKKVNKK